MTPRASRKEETRRRIVDTAASLFLRKGIDRVGVDEIMRECGLTHGGFYAHFPNREALISEACTAALGGTAQQWKSLVRDLADDAVWEGFLASNRAGELPASVNSVCAAAILGADVARRQNTIQASYVAKLRALFDTVAEEAGTDRSRAIVTIAGMVGATSLAAQVRTDQKLAAEILNSTRAALLER